MPDAPSIQPIHATLAAADDYPIHRMTGNASHRVFCSLDTIRIVLSALIHSRRFHVAFLSTLLFVCFPRTRGARAWRACHDGDDSHGPLWVGGWMARWIGVVVAVLRSIEEIGGWRTSVER